MKALLHQTSPKMIKLHQHPPDSTPRKSYGGDAQGRIHLNPFLGQPERVMERIQWEETPRLGVSKGMRIRIRLNPFLGQPERVMERIQREETPQLGVSEGIRLRISRKEPARVLSSDNPKGSWKGYKGLKPLCWGFPKG
jgi:hypothetical protein